jgi:hypothetical protein
MVAVPLLVFLGACSAPRIQPLMPTPVLFSELGFSPLDHVPAEERWTPRRVYFATTRVREDNLQRIDYSDEDLAGLVPDRLRYAAAVLVGSQRVFPLRET